jgi:3-hydroxyisobutyrate dehydrogenase-like beta-hydroxyacid dehydrogenase
MATVAFCGLGQMGAPMAGRLVDAGHEVTVWNRTAERAKPLEGRGARIAPTPAEAASGADAAFTMVSTPEAVEEVVLGEQGVARTLSGGAAFIEMSTIGPRAVHDIRTALTGEVDMLDAPVLGSVPQAEEGALKIFVGGEAESFDRWRETLQAMGSPLHIGPLGSGAAIKLVANAALLVLITGLAESLALADSFGPDQEIVLDVLEGSPLGPTVKRKRKSISTGEFEPDFKLALARKDARLVEEAAAEQGMELRLAPAARAWMDEARDEGFGDLDYSAVIAHARGREPG